MPTKPSVGERLNKMFGEKMKKRVLIILGVLVLAGTAIFSGTWMNTKKRSRPLYGNFDICMKCMGGHENFLDLEADDAYDNCPGHRELKRIGRVVRTKDSVTIIDPRDDAPWFRVDWDGSGHSLSFLKRPDSQSLMGMIPVRGAINQVTNPWRLTLPRCAFFAAESKGGVLDFQGYLLHGTSLRKRCSSERRIAASLPVFRLQRPSQK